jgi:hypothetical protein
MERSRLVLGALRHSPEHLGAGSLVEADLRIHDLQGIEHAGDTEGRELSGE